MKMQGHYDVTVTITPKIDSVLGTLSSIWEWDSIEDSEPVTLTGKIAATCDYYPGTFANGEQGYPPEYFYEPEIDGSDIENMLEEIYPELEISAVVGEFVAD